MFWEGKLHINILELRVVRLACKAFLPLIESCHIQLVSNNITAVVYMNKQGTARSPFL